MSITEPHNVLLNFAVISLEIVHILRMNYWALPRWTEHISYPLPELLNVSFRPYMRASAYDLTLPRPNDAY